MANYLSLPFCPGRQTKFIEHYDQSNHQYTFHTITPKLNCKYLGFQRIQYLVNLYCIDNRLITF